jgi:hypothetical protein
MKQILFLPFVLLGLMCGAQTIVTDPVADGLIAANGAAQNSRLDNMNNHLTLIQAAQTAALANLTFINTIQNDIYNGLKTVSSTLRNATDIIVCGEIANNIYTWQSKMISAAGSDPVLLAFAEKSEYQVILKATDLITYIQTTILHEGSDLLIDAGDRAKLINHVKDELSVICGASYGAYRAVWTAGKVGLLKSLNPYKGYINMDKIYAQQALQNFNSILK